MVRDHLTSQDVLPQLTRAAISNCLEFSLMDKKNEIF